VNLGWAYIGMFWNYVDCALIAMGVATAVFGYLFFAPRLQLQAKMEKPTPYMDFYTLASARYKFDVALAGVLFIAWIRVRPITTVLVSNRGGSKSAQRTRAHTPYPQIISKLPDLSRIVLISMNNCC